MMGAQSRTSEQVILTDQGLASLLHRLTPSILKSWMAAEYIIVSTCTLTHRRVSSWRCGGEGSSEWRHCRHATAPSFPFVSAFSIKIHAPPLPPPHYPHPRSFEPIISHTKIDSSQGFNQISM